MKRSLDLIREILIAIEDYEPERISSLQTLSPKDFSGTEAENYHHIKMLRDAGLIDLAGQPLLSGDFPISGMTMSGHDFLDAIRDQGVWDKTKNRLSKAGGWTLDLVLAVAKEELKRRLGLGLQDL
ncbi:hypothetical protein AN189_06430 [Loktanella sp. 3ANDIMAR09]|uniref:DUF2513 domain-containing protein n=1 Tax=Loktanella sp. 3ANDIMAR09 TaxID=1225657 RepID=UPI0006F91A69|nr:DUF2513 domain-containing protein [Loktanella sp. 3ANDIMAR09]KQI69198.1 hypothetical protein AN189_06430 [Loktanella sp. 3ANDIMAR09]